MSSFTTFTDGERTAVGFIAVGAAFSTFAISVAIVRVSLVALWPILQGKGVKARKDSIESIFYHTQLGIYAVCLLVANLLTSSGALVEITWASQGGIQPGGTCSTQGSLIQIGDFGIAYFMTAMAAHTLNSLVLKRKFPVWFIPSIIFVGCLAAVLIGAASQTAAVASKGSFYTNVGLWCWISDNYPGAQFGLHYLWTILAQTISFIIYLFIYLHIRGFIYMDRNQAKSLKWRWKVPKSGAHCEEGCLDGSEDYCHFLAHIAKVMLLFPLSYTILLLPITASRLAEISGANVSYEVFGFSAVMASLLGVANVLIMYIILRVLAPAYKNIHGSQGSPDVESFFTPERPTTPPLPPVEKPPPARPARPFPPPNSRVVSIASEPYRQPGSRDYAQALNDTIGDNFGNRPLRYARSSQGDGQTEDIPLEKYRFPPVSNRNPTRMGMPSNPRPTVHTQPSAFHHRRYNTDPSPSSTSTAAQLINQKDSRENRIGKHSHSTSETSAASTSSFGQPIIPVDAFVLAAAMPTPETVLTRDATGFRPSHRRAELTIGSASSADSLGMPNKPNRARTAPQAWIQNAHPVHLVPGGRMQSPGSLNSSSPLSSANSSRSPEISSSSTRRILSPPSRELTLSLSSSASSPPSYGGRQITSPPMSQLSPVVEVDYTASIRPTRNHSHSPSKRHISIMSVDDLSPVPTVPRPASRAQQASQGSREDVEVISPNLSSSRSRSNSFDSVDSLPLAGGEDKFVEVAVHTPTAFHHELLARSESLISMYLEKPQSTEITIPVHDNSHYDSDMGPRAELELSSDRQPESDPEPDFHPPLWPYQRSSTQKSESVIDMYLSRSPPPPENFRISLSIDQGPMASLEAVILASGIEPTRGTEGKNILSPVEEMDVPVTALPSTFPLFASPKSIKRPKLDSASRENSTSDYSFRAELQIRTPGLPDMPGLSSPGWAALVTKAAFGGDESPVGDDNNLRQVGHFKSNSEGHIPIGLAPVPVSARSILPHSPRYQDRPESVYEDVSFFRPASLITLDKRGNSRRNRR